MNDNKPTNIDKFLEQSRRENEKARKFLTAATFICGASVGITIANLLILLFK